MIEIITLKPEQAEEARRLIYTVAHLVFPSARTLQESIALYRQDWPLKDMDDIQKNYHDNGGTFLAVLVDGKMAGTGAIRRLDEGVCELKRFWFLPTYHGSGLARVLLERLEEMARTLGYHCMRLETSPEYQPRAYAFYHKNGFYDIPRFGDDPDDIGMEKILRRERI